MLSLALTHNYSLVVQYRHNDSVYCCGLYICSEKVQGGNICVSTSLMAPQRPQHPLTVLSTYN